MRIVVVIFVLVFVALLFLLFFPFKIRVRAHFNIVSNNGFFCVRFAFFNILCGRLRFANDFRFEIETQKTFFDIEKKISKRTELFLKHLIKQVDVMFLDFVFEGGKKDDAYITSLLCGGVQAASSALFSILKTKNVSGSFRKNVLVDFQKNAIAFSIDTAISISVFDIFKSYIFSIKNAHNKAKED